MRRRSQPSSSTALERQKAKNSRPDICIGTDPFHTSEALRNAFVGSFARAGWTVSVDSPFAGALVPSAHFETDSRVAAVMVEVNRALYMDESTSAPLPNFVEVAGRIGRCCVQAVFQFGANSRHPA